MTERVRTVGAILVNQRGEILLQQRDDKPDLPFAGCWTTFGGRVEPGETPDEAMQRELLEEIELAPALRLWKVYDKPSTRAPEHITVEQYLYVGRLDREAADIIRHEGQDHAFFGLDDLNEIPIAFGFEPVFREFFETYLAAYLRDGR
jgi:8-oxo-dGTP diphosphatase